MFGTGMYHPGIQCATLKSLQKANDEKNPIPPPPPPSKSAPSKGCSPMKTN